MQICFRTDKQCQCVYKIPIMCCIAFCLYWLQDLASECPVDLYADSVRTCSGCNFRGKLQKLQYCYHRVILSQYS